MYLQILFHTCTLVHRYFQLLYTSTSSASDPQTYCNLIQSIVATAEASALPTAATAPKQELVAAAVAPVMSTVSAAPSTAANVLSCATVSVVPLAAPQAPAVFKQLQQPKTYNRSTSWKDYKAHFEKVCKVNAWVTAQDKAQNLTLFLEGPAADVLKDEDELAHTAYEDIWKQLGRRFGYTDAPSDAMRRFDGRR